MLTCCLNVDEWILKAQKMNYFNIIDIYDYSEFCCVLCPRNTEVTPHSPPDGEKRPAASEDESEASETEDRQTPAAGQTDSTPATKKKKRKNRKKKKKAATVE